MFQRECLPFIQVKCREKGEGEGYLVRMSETEAEYNKNHRSAKNRARHLTTYNPGSRDCVQMKSEGEQQKMPQ